MNDEILPYVLFGIGTCLALMLFKIYKHYFKRRPTDMVVEGPVLKDPGLENSGAMVLANKPPPVLRAGATRRLGEDE